MFTNQSKEKTIMDVQALAYLQSLNQSSQSTSTSASSDVDFSSYLDSGSQTLEDIFKKASDTYGISEDLLKAVAKQESNFDASATSSVGAQGIMQLMPATAEELGVTDAYDAEQNIMGGAKYLSQLLSKYNGDTSLALAAYNAGSGNVAKYGGIPPFAETQNYVTKVLGYMNEGVSVPDETVSTSSTSALTSDTENGSAANTATQPSQDITSSNIDTLLSSLDELLGNTQDNGVFDQEDYLTFLNIFLENLIQTDSDDTSSTSILFGESDQSDETDSSNQDKIYQMQQINYNNSVLNLLNSTGVF